jgi:hypothetical protein
MRVIPLLGVSVIVICIIACLAWGFWCIARPQGIRIRCVSQTSDPLIIEITGKHINNVQEVALWSEEKDSVLWAILIDGRGPAELPNLVYGMLPESECLLPYCRGARQLFPAHGKPDKLTPGNYVIRVKYQYDSFPAEPLSAFQYLRFNVQRDGSISPGEQRSYIDHSARIRNELADLRKAAVALPAYE